MTFPSRIKDLLKPTGTLAAEVPASCEDLRAFVSVTRFASANAVSGAKRFAHLGEHEYLYALKRYELDTTLCDNQSDVHERELLNRDEIVLADVKVVESILLTWLNSWDDLVLERDCDNPY